MLALAHQAHGGLLHEAIAWAFILSMSRITTELNACIGPPGARWAAARGYRVGLHTFNEHDHYRAKCSHRPIGHTVGCCTRLSCGPAYFQFNERDHYRAKCSHWPIGHTAACCTRLSYGPTNFQ